MIRRTMVALAAGIAGVRFKRWNELHYWKARKKSEGDLSALHYQRFYTDHFGLHESFYADKTVLDIGCGPRGSLEWATMAKRRIGLDPLAGEYLKLGADRHQMEYICSPSESIPLLDGECDVVCSFNSLDHVEDVDGTLREIKRVTAPGGLFFLLVEVNHLPTRCEPHKIVPANLVEALRPEFMCEDMKLYQPTAPGIYDSIDVNQQLQRDDGRVAFMSAKFLRN